MRSSGRRHDRHGRTSLRNVLLIGCGKMGSAMLRGWSRISDLRIFVVKPSPMPAEFDGLKSLFWTNSADGLPSGFCPDALVVAVKPQIFFETLPDYSKFKNGVFLSIAAGHTIGGISAILSSNDNDYAIVRAMPNLPASVGMGISAAVKNRNVTQVQKELCDELLKACGEVVWLDDESLIDAVTALSGSGPAYFFAMAEAMAKAGTKLGLPKEISEKLARRTLEGSGYLLIGSRLGVSELRAAVTSPNGTTEAALKIMLSENGLFELTEAAMKAAAERAKELSKQV